MKQRSCMTNNNTTIGKFEKFVFPMIRATYPSMVAEEFVNVQPMFAKFPSFYIEDPEIIALNDLIDKAEKYYKEKEG